jgi:YVTN family beta-propeller protein
VSLLGSAASWFSGSSNGARYNAAVEHGAGRAAAGCVLGDINCDGIVDTRDYGLWRQSFGQTNCGNPADLDGNCMVDIQDYAIWRTSFGRTGPTATPTITPTATSTSTSTPTATPTPCTRCAYVVNNGSNNVTVIDTTTNTVVGAPIPVGRYPGGVGVDPTVHRAYVPDPISNSVTVIDTTTNTVVGAPIPVGTWPVAVGIGP